MKTFHGSQSQLLLVAMCSITLLINGCEAMDSFFSDSTPAPSSANSTPSSPLDTPVTPPTSKSDSSNPQIDETINDEGERNEEELNQLVQSKECIPPNQVEYVYGNFQIGWTFAGTRHEGLLSMNGRVGKMRIQFFDQAENSTSEVDQIMLLASCAKGLVILGFAPVVAGTDEKAINYTPDNLIFRRETSGKITLLNCYQGGCSPIEMQQVSNN